MSLKPRFLCLTLCLLLLVPLVLLPLSGCEDKETAVENGVRSVTYDPKGDTIRLEIDLTEEYVKANQSRLYLFELPAGTTDLADLSGLEPVADTAVRSTRVIMRLAASSGARSRLFSSFVPAALDRDTGAYTPIAAPAALDSLTAEAEDKPSRAIKGVTVGSSTAQDADAVRLGISATVIRVRMDHLMLSAWEPDAVGYVWDGTTRWLRASEVEALDARVDYFTRLGIKVYLRLVLGRDDPSSCPDALYMTEASSPEQYGVNMSDSAAAELTEGFLCWLVRQYCTDNSPVGRGLCRDLIIGETVNLDRCWDSGRMTPDQKVGNYERLLRAADTALSLYAPAGGAFADVGVIPEGDDAETGLTHTDFLKKLSAAAEARGTFHWHVSGRIDAPSAAVWTDDCPQIRDLLSQPSELLDTGRQNAERNAARRFILTISIPDHAGQQAADEVSQAASYAYVYTAAAAEGRAEALLWDTSAEALRREDGSPREVWDMIAAADTQDAASRLSVARSVVGKEFDLLGVDVTTLPTHVQRADLDAQPNVEHYATASDVLTFADGTLHGFTNGGGLLYAGLTSPDGVTRLRAQLSSASAGSPAGISTVLEPSAIEHARTLILPLSVNGSDRRSGAAVLTVLLMRPAGDSDAPDDQAILYRYVLNDVMPGDVSVSCDISDFTDLLDKDDAVILSVLLEPAGSGTAAYSFTLEAVRAIGVRHSVVLTVILIVCGAVFLTAALIALWFLFRSGKLRLPDLPTLFKKQPVLDYAANPALLQQENEQWDDE